MKKGTVIVVGLGPGNAGHISVETLEVMKNAKEVILRTQIHPSVPVLTSAGINFVTCDHFYEEGHDFEQVYDKISNYVLQEAQNKNVVYAVPGSPLVAERTVVLLREKAANLGIVLQILPSMSFLDLIYTKVGIDPIEGVRVIDAQDKRALADAGKYPLIITQVYSKLVASELKINLMNVLSDETEVVFLRNLGLQDEDFLKIPLFELDRQKHIDHLTTLYIPAIKTIGIMDIKPLDEVVKTLRSPKGCPWDRVQTHSSIRKGMLEEVYELLEAIDDKDIKGMREELGDVLLQVVFHARLAEEEGVFTMQDVIDDIVAKLIHRHPHVYGTIEISDAEEVLRNWETIKAEEKKDRKRVLDGVTKGLPALMRAYKIQSKAAKVGFDWKNKQDVWAKVLEEMNELQEAVEENIAEHIEWELGDAFLALVNYARHLGLEPETALNLANNRFCRRFDYVEDKITATGREWSDFSLLNMDVFWEEAKKNEKKH
ncbi:MAG: nucleoside triphosphate pyrophosphohydrolase [Acidaminococcaceae bacterium]|nr:nucleoside triphosphate pyrophosphohydrolase [Acidaminococcaceae bacterium]